MAGARKDMRLGRLWLHGTPLWEFQFSTQGLNDEPPRTIAAEVVLLDASVLPLTVLTALGPIAPRTEPCIAGCGPGHH